MIERIITPENMGELVYRAEKAGINLPRSADERAERLHDLLAEGVLNLYEE